MVVDIERNPEDTCSAVSTASTTECPEASVTGVVDTMSLDVPVPFSLSVFFVASTTLFWMKMALVKLVTTLIRCRSACISTAYGPWKWGAHTGPIAQKTGLVYLKSSSRSTCLCPLPISLMLYRADMLSFEPNSCIPFPRLSETLLTVRTIMEDQTLRNCVISGSHSRNIQMQIFFLPTCLDVLIDNLDSRVVEVILHFWVQESKTQSD